MTTTSDQLSPGDQRRAVSLLLHTIGRDRIGIATVIEEAEDLERSPHLIVALCHLTTTFAPPLLLPQGQAALRATAALLAADEDN